MHTAKSLNEAIALGTSVGSMSAVQRQMKVHLTNYIKLCFIDAMIAAGDKPFGPEELSSLLTEILAGKK